MVSVVEKEYVKLKTRRPVRLATDTGKYQASPIGTLIPHAIVQATLSEDLPLSEIPDCSVMTDWTEIESTLIAAKDNTAVRAVDRKRLTAIVPDAAKPSTVRQRYSPVVRRRVVRHRWR
jgi:hypothetical protein